MPKVSTRLQLPKSTEIELLEYIEQEPRQRWSHYYGKKAVPHAVSMSYDGFKSLLEKGLIKGEGWGPYKITARGNDLLKLWKEALPLLRKIEAVYHSSA